MGDPGGLRRGCPTFEAGLSVLDMQQIPMDPGVLQAHITAAWIHIHVACVISMKA